MMLHPRIMALMVASFFLSAGIVCAAALGIRILVRWDIQSGNELQLRLERATYLTSSILALLLPLQVIQLFFFINTADSLSTYFTGAMCAVGTLAVNPFGFPSLFLAVPGSILAGVWLVMNHADSKGEDYPLIRQKYLLLLLLAPVIVAESVMQAMFFLRLSPDMLTSCCGTLFDRGKRSIASDLAYLPNVAVAISFFGVQLIALATGALIYFRERLYWLHGIASILAFPISIAAVISLISQYIYEMPNHHCPFCLLQGEYHYIGYPLYLALMVQATAGGSAAFIHRFRSIPSISRTLPFSLQKLALLSMLSSIVILAIASISMLLSPFRM